MANRAATLYIRITKNGRSSFCKPVYQSKGRLKPQYVECRELAMRRVPT